MPSGCFRLRPRLSPLLKSITYNNNLEDFPSPAASFNHATSGAFTGCLGQRGELSACVWRVRLFCEKCTDRKSNRSFRSPNPHQCTDRQQVAVRLQEALVT